ncbi:MAG: hypothetical protein V1753_04390 [Pseudomonadota bacterium]
MPYHLEAIGVAWPNLAPQFKILFLAFLKGGGAGALASGIAIGIMTIIPFRKDELWAQWTIPLVGLTLDIPVLYSAITVAKGTTASPPMEVIAVAILLFIAGFLCSLKGGVKAESND